MHGNRVRPAQHALRGDKPLYVLTAGDGSDAEDLIADEQDSGATTQAILDVVTAIRDRAPLTE